MALAEYRDDWQPAFGLRGAHPAHDFGAVHRRHAHVQQNQIGRGVRNHLESGRAVGRFCDGEAEGLEHLSHHAAVGGDIIDHQHRAARSGVAGDRRGFWRSR